MRRFASMLFLPLMLACGGSTSTPESSMLDASGSTTGSGTTGTNSSTTTTGPGTSGSTTTTGPGTGGSTTVAGPGTSGSTTVAGPGTSGSTTTTGPGTTTVGGAGGAGGAGGTGGAGGASGTGGTGVASVDGGTCSFPRSPGAFTFHVRNTGSAPMKLTFRCGRKLPIELDTPDGKRGTGPGNVDTLCELSCDGYTTDTNHCPDFCTDCGPGVVRTVMPGATADVQWDRRVYVAGRIERQCTAASCDRGGVCAYGIPVAPKADQKGTLTICTDPNALGVYCPTTRTVDFTIDTTSGEGTIDAR